MQALWKEIAQIEASPRSLRSFGFVVGGALLLVATAIWVWRGFSPPRAAVILGGAGLLLVALGLVAPWILKAVYYPWMALALVLGYIMTRLVLTAVFFLLITPTGMIMRLFGRDPLQRKRDPEAATYWIPKNYDHDSPERLEKYY